MRTLIRPTLFMIARLGLFLAVAAWIVGQWWTAQIRMNILGCHCQVEAVQQGVIFRTNEYSVTYPTPFRVERIPYEPSWTIFDLQMQDYWWELDQPVTTLTSHVVILAWSSFNYTVAISYKLIVVAFASIFAFLNWRYWDRQGAKPLVWLKKRRVLTLLIVVGAGAVIAWGCYEFWTLEGSQPSENSLSPTNGTVVRDWDPVINTIGMKLMLIPTGEFLMGSPKREFSRESDERQHVVQIKKQFYIQTTETTQGQWKTVMGTEPWKEEPWNEDVTVPAGDEHPATYVNWDEANEFCRKLSDRDGLSYRLPTEAEWEYACRGGIKTAFSFSDRPQLLVEYDWFARNAKDVGEAFPHRVGLKLPNAFRLHDMHGNVSEFCSDVDPSDDESRAVRGGTWYSLSFECRSAARDWFHVSDKNCCMGFRVVCEAMTE